MAQKSIYNYFSVNSRQSEKGPDSSTNNSSDKSGSLTLPTTSEDRS